MSKKLPTENMVNELAGASVFFQANVKEDQHQAAPRVESENGHTAARRNPQISLIEKSRNHTTTVAGKRDSQTSTNQVRKDAGHNHGSVHADYAAKATTFTNDEDADLIEQVRKRVKQLGKEAATHRFTEEEKRAIADLVYTYHRQGYRTSENEITRIAVNWLLTDFEERGQQSILAQMLERLHG